MTFEERKAIAMKLMDNKKMWRSNYAPPLLRGLWRMGFEIPPLPFISFWKLFLSCSFFFSVVIPPKNRCVYK
ncbi:Uncharacterised protein [Serratia liquefaciens]|nr:Uncharacterised protein [Serratia liquefaciens]